MLIDGVFIKQDAFRTLCIIEELSDALKKLIREELAAVMHGSNEVLELPEYHTYHNTLGFFLDRYEKKSQNIKKGMIGELLSHILMPKLFDHLTSVSVLKNKEERSIKKGFDIIFCDLGKKKFWYSEVKSGHLNAALEASDANDILLNRAYTGIEEMFLSGRDSLWQSAIIDVALTVEGGFKTTLKKLLSQDSPLVSSIISKDKNVILVSVLYEDTLNSLKPEDIDGFFESIKDKGGFQEIIICSIQKGTYEKVAEFLKEESQNG